MSSHTSPAVILSGVHTSLDHCGHCGKSAQELEQPLKMCKGCRQTAYCDKACQKAAWAGHKASCTDPDGKLSPEFHSGLQRKGYGQTAMGLVAAVRNWLNIHHQTVEVMANAAVYRNGGVINNLNPQRALVITLGFSAAPGASENPAKHFDIPEFEIIDRPADSSDLSAQWDHMVALARERHAEFVSSGSVPPHYAGTLPAAVRIWPLKGKVLYEVEAYSIYHPRSRNDTANDSARRGTILKDVHNMCYTTVLGGYTFKMRPGDFRSIPRVESMVFVRNAWRQEPADRDDGYWRKIKRIMETKLPRPALQFESGLAPFALWHAFGNL